MLCRPDDLSIEQMASLEAALKTAIQVHFQLEDRELATEALPSSDERKHILLYEAAEGGAGVLRRLAEDADTLPAIARLALEVAHFDPDTGINIDRVELGRTARRRATTACSPTSTSATTVLLDRQLLPDLLRPLMQASVRTSPAPVPREDQLTRLLNLCQSELERKWARTVDHMGLKLPSDAQRLVESCGVRPDFLYRDEGVAIFIDGPPHDTPEQREKDDEQQDALEDRGLTVIRFHHTEEWEPILRRYGQGSTPPSCASCPASSIAAT